MRYCSFLLIAWIIIACRSSRETITIRNVDYAQLVTILDSFDFTISPINVSQPDLVDTISNMPSVQPMRVYGHRVRHQQATISAIDTTQIQARKSAAPTQRQDTTRSTSYNLFAVFIISAIVATAVAILRKLFFSRSLMF